jgi:antibiotic biosynthesis monooxygenase (ABM) superfamily enzyme
LHGLETWFALPERTGVAAPSRAKVWLLTWLAVFPVILAVRLALRPLDLDRWPMAAQAFVLSGLLVPLITFVVMPAVTRLFANWLYPGIAAKTPVFGRSPREGPGR